MRHPSTSIFLLFFATLGCGSARPGPAPAPVIANEPAALTEPAAAADEQTCCCTFTGVVPEELGVVSTWAAATASCKAGDPDHAPGQCIAWQWCSDAPGTAPPTLAERPDLAPPAPPAAGTCCCDVFDGQGEAFSIQDRASCAQIPDAACVDAGFCGRPSSP